MNETLLVIAPILACVAGAVLTMAADAIGWPRVAVFFAVAGVATAAGFAGYTAVSFEGSVVAYDAFIGGGGISAAVTALLGLSALALLGGAGSYARRSGGAGAAALVAFASAGAAALAQSVDLVMTIIALETVAVCAYALVATGHSERSSEAAMKYVIQGAVSTGLLLLGAAILFGLYGGESAFVSIGANLREGPILPGAVGGSLVLVALGFKLGAAPFHSWAPDVFETAPPVQGAFLASAPKIGALVAAFILASTVLVGNVGNLEYQVAVIAVLSVVVGSLGGLRQTSYTRLLGYSGIAQIGYALAGLTVGVATGGAQLGSMFPLTLVLVVSYGLAAVGAFLVADVVRAARPSWDGSLEGMAGLGKERPFIGIAAGALMFSLTGIPLTAGFWGKLLVFGAAISTGWAWLATVCIIGSVISFGYYGNVVRWLFFEGVEPEGAEDEEDGTETVVQRSVLASGVVGFIALAVVAVGVVPLFTGIEPLVALFS